MIYSLRSHSSIAPRISTTACSPLLLPLLSFTPPNPPPHAHTNAAMERPRRWNGTHACPRVCVCVLMGKKECVVVFALALGFEPRIPSHDKCDALPLRVEAPLACVLRTLFFSLLRILNRAQAWLVCYVFLAAGHRPCLLACLLRILSRAPALLAC